MVVGAQIQASTGQGNQTSFDDYPTSIDGEGDSTSLRV
jgi:hypothetical protein